MSRIQKYKSLQNLAGVRVYKEDTDPQSKYFQVREMPDILHAGKNAFLIVGSEPLVQETNVLVEIVDSEGDVVFSQPIRDYAEGQARVVSIEVYETTPPGSALLTILGELAVEDDGVTRVPEQWRGVYNVRWQKQLTIDPLRPNDTRIRMYNIPELKVSEVLSTYRKTVTSSLQNQGFLGQAQGISLLRSTGSNIENIYTIKYSGTGAGGGAASASRELLDNGSFTASLASDYSTSIIDVINASTIVVDPAYVVGSQYSPFVADEWTLQWNNIPDFSPTTMTRSYAEVDITNLLTFSGQVSRVKLFMRSADSDAQYELITDQEIVANELLSTQSVYLGTIDNMGDFISQSVVDSFWTVGLVSGSPERYDYSDPLNTISASVDSVELLDAIKFADGTTQSLDDDLLNGVAAQPFFYGLNSDNEIDFIQGLEYVLSWRHLCVKNNDTFDATLDIYLTGSAFPSASNPLGVNIASYTVPAGEIRNLQRDLDVNFLALETGTARLNFVSRQGMWYVSDVSLTPAVERGFNPDVTTFITQVTGKRYEQLQFKAQLFDINNNAFPQEIFAPLVYFDGGNMLLQGPDHRVEGTLTIAPSGSGITLTTEGYLDEDGTPLSGSAIYTGEGRWFHRNTAILFAEEVDGDPRISFGDKLKGYVDPVTDEFVLIIVGNILVGSGSNFTDIRSFFGQDDSDEFFHRIRGFNVDFWDIQGKKAITAGNVQTDSDTNFENSEQIVRLGRYTRGTTPRFHPPESPLVVPGATGSFDPFSAAIVTQSLVTSATLDVPASATIWNNTIYGNVTVQIEEKFDLADSSYKLEFELIVDTSWVGFESGSSAGLGREDLNIAGTRTKQTLAVDDLVWITESGSYSPDPYLAYAVHIPEERPLGYDTLYVTVRLDITAEGSN